MSNRRIVLFSDSKQSGDFASYHPVVDPKGSVAELPCNYTHYLHSVFIFKFTLAVERLKQISKEYLGGKKINQRSSLSAVTSFMMRGKAKEQINKSPKKDEIQKCIDKIHGILEGEGLRDQRNAITHGSLKQKQLRKELVVEDSSQNYDSGFIPLVRGQLVMSQGKIKVPVDLETARMLVEKIEEVLVELYKLHSLFLNRNIDVLGLLPSPSEPRRAKTYCFECNHDFTKETPCEHLVFVNKARGLISMS